MHFSKATERKKYIFISTVLIVSDMGFLHLNLYSCGLCTNNHRKWEYKVATYFGSSITIKYSNMHVAENIMTGCVSMQLLKIKFPTS